MTHMSRERKLLIFAGVLLCGGGQGILINTLSIFVKPVTESLGFDRGPFALYASIISLVAVATLPLYGELYRKTWFPQFMVASAVVCSAALFSYSFCASLPAFYVLSVILGLFFHGTSITAVANVLSRWFGRNKGLATGICFSGSGIFAAVMLRLTNPVIEQFGWAWGYRLIGISGLILLSVGSVIVCWVESRKPFCLRHDDPEFSACSRGSASLELTRREAVHTCAFWGLLLGCFLISASVQAGGSSIAAYLSDLGYDTSFQGQLASVSMLALAAGKILIGKLLDRTGMRVGFVCITGALAGYAVSLIFLDRPVFAALYVIFYGIAASGSTVLVSYSVISCFGSADYSRIYALTSIAVNLGVAAGNWVPGEVFDLWGSYLPGWYALVVVALVVGVLFAMTSYDQLKRCAATYRRGKEEGISH